jgi:hypothetical protein
MYVLLSLAVLTACAHEATAVWDVRAAVDGGREVRPIEQHVHSFLESMPFMAVSALLCLHWDQVIRARRSGFSDRSAWKLRPRRPRLPGHYLATMLAGVTLLIGVPYAEELLRCLRSRGAQSQAACLPGRP